MIACMTFCEMVSCLLVIPEFTSHLELTGQQTHLVFSLGSAIPGCAAQLYVDHRKFAVEVVLEVQMVTVSLVCMAVMLRLRFGW